MFLLFELLHILYVLCFFFSINLVCFITFTCNAWLITTPLEKPLGIAIVLGFFYFSHPLNPRDMPASCPHRWPKRKMRVCMGNKELET